MRILIVSQYFWPESFIINQIAETLDAQGHQLVVLTGKPNYPKGEIYNGYKQKGILHEKLNNVEIIRVPLRPRKSGNAKNLVLNYLSFIWSGLLHFPPLVKNKQFDVILVFALSPITSAIPAIFLKYLKRTHLAIWIQDLWPDSIAATGFIKNKLMLKVKGYLVRVIYSLSDTLLVQSKAFIGPVNAMSSHKKVMYFPNIMTDMKKSRDEVNNLLPAYLCDYLDNYFCFVFAGNIGKAQSIETLISAAQKLNDVPEVRIVIVGAGSMLNWAMQEVERQNIKNIIFTGSFSIDVMPALFARAKALLVLLADQEIFSYTIPSKVQAYMSAGRPLIASINGEAARVIKEAKAGLTCPAEDYKSLATRIIEFFNMSEQERDIIADNGRRYFLENFEMQRKCKDLIEILQKKIEIKKQESK